MNNLTRTVGFRFKNKNEIGKWNYGYFTILYLDIHTAIKIYDITVEWTPDYPVKIVKPL